AKWLAIIGEHAAALKRETSNLREELQPIFFATPPLDDAPEDAALTDDASLMAAIERLFELCSAHERAIRSAFSVSSETSASSLIKGPPFWRSLARAERLAASIQKAVTSDK